MWHWKKGAIMRWLIVNLKQFIDFILHNLDQFHAACAATSPNKEEMNSIGNHGIGKFMDESTHSKCELHNMAIVLLLNVIGPLR